MNTNHYLGTLEYIVAAAPGWSVFYAGEEANTTEPILAWQIITSEYASAKGPDHRCVFFPRPITTDGAVEEDGDWAILTPAGVYEVQAETAFDDEHACARHLKNRAAERARTPLRAHHG